MSRMKKPSGRERTKRTEGHKSTAISHFLIVCEGEETERSYFEQFPQPKDKEDGSITVRGTGRNTDSLVKETLLIKAKLERKERRMFTDIWCVFDRDSFPDQNFNQALESARFHNMKVAYTNEAFELWYLLHFHYYNTPMSRHEYQDKLSESKCLSFRYKKKNPEMYAILLNRQPVAIKYAENLCKSHHLKNDCTSTKSQFKPVDSNPITRVHVLVSELNKAYKNFTGKSKTFTTEK